MGGGSRASQAMHSVRHDGPPISVGQQSGERFRQLIVQSHCQLTLIDTLRGADGYVNVRILPLMIVGSVRTRQ
jgi:hypothetical protein